MKFRASENSLILGATISAIFSLGTAPGCGGTAFNGIPNDAVDAGNDSPTANAPDSSLAGDGSATPDAPAAADAPGEPPPVPPPAGCDPTVDAKDSLPCVANAFGVFVSVTEGADTNAGTKASPMKTLVGAIAKAAASGLPRIYVCEGTYPEALTFDASHDGLSVFGGWACGTWKHTGTRAKIAPGSAGPVVKLTKTLRPVALVDVHVVAGDAAAAGGSSVAVRIDSAQKVFFRRSKFQAGAGASGTAGAPGAAASGVKVGEGFMCAGTNMITAGGPGAPIGPAPEFACTQDGQDGQPSPPVGGAGGSQAGSGTLCTAGGPGKDGQQGASGAGATAFGALTAAAWTPSNGTPGSAGTLGGGGGGGGCGSGGNLRGGNGGAGGCGSGGGGFGTGGGASIAVISVDTTTTFEACDLITSTGGGGGAGGSALSGQLGLNGAALGFACGGGKGGNGGAGGAGGGGAGGLSVGVLYTVRAPTLSQSSFQVGAGGNGGAAGGGGPTSARGVDGASTQTLLTN